MNMKLIKITENSAKEYDLLINHINIIKMDTGLLRLPKCDELAQLTILFCCKGAFTIEGRDKQISLSSCSSYQVEITPGKYGCETEPTFIHCDDEWFILTSGNIVFPEELMDNLT